MPHILVESTDSHPRTAQRQHYWAREHAGRCAEVSPGLHQLATLLEQVAAPIGGFHLVADCMGEGHFNNLRREPGGLRCPIAECAAEPMGSQIAPIHPP